MRLFIFLSALLLIPIHSSAAGNELGKSFSQAKNILHKDIHGDHKVTFYGKCQYDDKKQVNWASCGYEPRKQAKRGSRVEWEHVMPAWEFGHQLQCWQKGGRKNCRKNPKFKAMESDMHNLRPAIGELNADRSNFRFGMIQDEPRKYGEVDFEVDFKQRVAEPSPSVRGDIARTYFYMENEYGIRISRKQLQLFKAWEKSDPVDDWERERNRRIDNIQGNRNSFVW